MMNGSSFVKVKASGRQFRRFFYLEEDLSGLRWMPSSKKSSRAKRKKSNFFLLISWIRLRFAWLSQTSTNETYDSFIFSSLLCSQYDFSMQFSYCPEVAIKAIKEVRTGKSTEVMRNKDVNSSVSEDCVFSIIFGDDFESLDLMSPSPEEANIWVTGINFLISSTKCRSTFLTWKSSHSSHSIPSSVYD